MLPIPLSSYQYDNPRLGFRAVYKGCRGGKTLDRSRVMDHRNGRGAFRIFVDTYLRVSERPRSFSDTRRYVSASDGSPERPNDGSSDQPRSLSYSDPTYAYTYTGIVTKLTSVAFSTKCVGYYSFRLKAPKTTILKTVARFIVSVSPPFFLRP